MNAKKLYQMICLLVIAGLLLAACGAPQPERIVETVIVKEIVQGTPVEKIVERLVTPTPVPPTAVPPTAVPQAVDTVVFGMQQEPDTLHPSLSTMSAATMVYNPLYLGCMAQDEKLQWVPLGCETIPTLENGGAALVGEGADRHLEVTYKIRDGWRWTDGTPVTSKDAVYWWKLNMDPNFESQGRTTIEQIYTIEPKDDQTFVVKYLSNDQLRKAVEGKLTGEVDFASFKEDYLAAYGPDWSHFAVNPGYWYNINWLPEHILSAIPAADQDESEYARKPVGDGAFVLTEWKPGQEIVLEKSDKPFPLGDPKVKTIIFRFYGDGSGVKAALQSGEIDAALGTVSGLTEADGPDLDAIEASGRYKMEWVPQYQYEHIDLNVGKFPLDDAKVRQALIYALDREAINQAQYYGKKALSDLPLPKISWAYPPDSELNLYPYDPEKAKALLAEAGWDCSALPCVKDVNGETKKLEFTFMTTDRLDRQKVAQMIQAMWKKINVGVNLQFLYGRGLFANCSAGGPLYCMTYDAAMYGTTTGDDAVFYVSFACSTIPNESNNWSGQNNTGWCNKTANDALNESENNPEVALSREKRQPYMNQFFNELTKEVPTIVLYGGVWVYPHLVGWKNFRPGATQYSYPTWNAWEWEVEK